MATTQASALGDRWGAHPNAARRQNPPVQSDPARLTADARPNRASQEHVAR
jgi:hypothetical protein